MSPVARPLTRRTLVSSAAVAGAAVASVPVVSRAAPASSGPIVKPLPPRLFVPLGTNAEMRWDSVDPERYLTPQRRLFVRNHTSTPEIRRRDYALRVFGDGLERPRGESRARTLSPRDLRGLPRTHLVSVLECTGNGRSLFDTQQGAPAPGTAWTLGTVGTVRWEGVRLRDVLRHVGVAPDAVSVMAAGLDDEFVSGETNYGRVRRPFPIAKALGDALLAWRANGVDLLPDHGAPLRLVLPGWVGIASIKWLGSLEVSRTRLTSPWNTQWYRMTGGDFPDGEPPLTRNPVRSAWELPWEAQLPAGRPIRLTGRSWSGAGQVSRVDVSLDGGRTWRSADVERPQGGGWSRWSVRWRRPEEGATELLARAHDVRGRTQPDVAAVNDNGYFFDAVVRHPVTVR